MSWHWVACFVRCSLDTLAREDDTGSKQTRLPINQGLCVRRCVTFVHRRVSFHTERARYDTMPLPLQSVEPHGTV